MGQGFVLMSDTEIKPMDNLNADKDQVIKLPSRIKCDSIRKKTNSKK